MVYMGWDVKFSRAVISLVLGPPGPFENGITMFGYFVFGGTNYVIMLL